MHPLGFTTNRGAITFNVWDTAGQERFRTITCSFYKQAQGAMVVFNLSIEESFRNVKEWLDSINEHGDPNISKVLVGFKIDDDSRQITE